MDGPVEPRTDWHGQGGRLDNNTRINKGRTGQMERDPRDHTQQPHKQYDNTPYTLKQSRMGHQVATDGALNHTIKKTANPWADPWARGGGTGTVS